nr:MAG: ORF1 [Torque teno virus]
MAWRRWRWRPWWRRRRRRRWRRRRRRPRRRRPYRRRRPRRVRRRRGRWRRAYRRWGRRRRRRKHKKRLVLTQWQPAVVKRCLIVGYDPIIVCGINRTIFNYTTHSEDYTFNNESFGGGLCTTQYTLRILFQEKLAQHNFWSASNEDLDLSRYLGASLIFFRHPTVDFLVRVRTSPPFEDTDMTAMTLHPGMMMLAKKTIKIPSLKTRPSRKHFVRIRVGAPKLFEDKWYPQNELCDVTLLTIQATTADFQFPFGSPLTNSVCCNFQVLNSNYDNAHSILNFSNEVTNKWHTSRQNCYKFLLEQYSYYNTKQVVAQLKYGWNPNQNPKMPDVSNAETSKKPDDLTKSKVSSNYPHWDTLYGGLAYGDSTSTPGSASLKTDLKTQMLKGNHFYTIAGKKLIDTFTPIQFTDNSVTQPTNIFDYYTGMYCSIFLSSGRSNPEVKGSYTDISYNPLTDKGVGNMIWIDWLTKGDTVYDPKKSKCLLSDFPLWAMCYGYPDYCRKQTGDSAVYYDTRVVIRCPYTYPQLLKHNDKQFGFVVYSENFGLGRLPGGNPNPPTRMRLHWYPNMFHQTEVLECIAQSGPFAYHGDERKTVLTLKYKFRWKWGGNPVFQQVLRDPCTGGAVAPHTSRHPRSIQVYDPKYQAPEYLFHKWDFRRGLFSTKGIKRVSEQPVHDEYFTGSGKRPKKDTNPSPQEEEQKESSRFRVPELRPWLASSQETQSQSEQEETAPKTIQEQLQEQLQQQQLMGIQLRNVCLQLARVQAGHSLHPVFQSRA